MPDGLTCLCRMPLSWHAAEVDAETSAQLLREAALLLAALNQIESSHELEASNPENRRLDRIEAKLDLALHLLARKLQDESHSQRLPVELTPTSASWPAPLPPSEGTRLIVEFSPSSALPLSLKLPAIGMAPENGMARVRFEALGETLDEALYQFVFRRHRQAIRARSG
jgi:hypothetical protein